MIDGLMAGDANYLHEHLEALTGALSCKLRVEDSHLNLSLADLQIHSSNCRKRSLALQGLYNRRKKYPESLKGPPPFPASTRSKHGGDEESVKGEYSKYSRHEESVTEKCVKERIKEARIFWGSFASR